MNALDAVIVGGGPAGLSAALILARCCKRIVVIDAGQPRNAAARHLHGFVTRDGTPPLHLLSLARDELAKYGVEVAEDVVERATALRNADQSFPTLFAVTTRKGHVFTGRKLLIATGITDDLPDIPGLRECYGLSAHHCPYCDGYEHRSKRIVAFGRTAEDAIGLGLALRGWTDSVTVITNGSAVDDKQRKRLEHAALAVFTERVIRVSHESGRMTAVAFESAPPLAADAFFFNTGRRPSSDLAISLGCTFKDDATAETTEKQATCVPGVFLAGDADGDVQFVVVAAGEGATAAVAINREIQDENEGLSAKSVRGANPSGGVR